MPVSRKTEGYRSNTLTAGGATQPTECTRLVIVQHIIKSIFFFFKLTINKTFLPGSVEF